MAEEETKPAAAHPGMPKQLKVISKPYKVNLVTNLDGGEASGLTFARYQRIEIDPDQSFEAVRDTLLHEVFHAVEKELGLRMKEAQVHGMATGFLQVMRDNKHLVKFLMMQNPDPAPAEDQTD